jgi:multicomponent Na+:H+ antiporter subunit C
MGKIDGATAPIVPPDIAAAAAHHGDANHGETHGHDAVETAVETAHAVAQSATDYVAMTGIDADHIVYSNPLPSVLMLTAIVVGIATTALALALIVRVREDYGTVEEDEILKINQQEWAAGRERAAKKKLANQPNNLGGSAT